MFESEPSPLIPCSFSQLPKGTIKAGNEGESSEPPALSMAAVSALRQREEIPGDRGVPGAVGRDIEALSLIEDLHSGKERV